MNRLVTTLAVVLFFAIQQYPLEAKDITISGTVVRPGEKLEQKEPIKDVGVRAWRDGVASDPVMTDSNGKYRLSISSGAPIDAVTYSHGISNTRTRLFPGKAGKLSGIQNHTIHMVLYSPKDLKEYRKKTRPYAVLQQMNILGELYFLETHAPEPNNILLQSYGQSVELLAFVDDVAKGLDAKFRTVLLRRRDELRGIYFKR